MAKLKFDTIKLHIIKFTEQIDSVGNLSKKLPSYALEYSNRFVREEDRRRSIMTQYFLRKFLSYYLQVDFDKVAISYSKSGKPYLNDKINSNLKFNYSHSGDYIVYAFTTDNEIGIDIEKIKDIPEIDELSRTHFSDEEQLIYFELKNPEEKKRLFYKIWTRKEALLKAEGSGITIDLKSLTVLTTNEKNANQIKIKFLDKNWSITDIMLDTHYSSSVALNSVSYKKIVIYDKDFNLLRKI
ncbi:MAG: 4'-phosphopantetheinyl transferase superfamily protein [Ignavibacterium sp.]|nr:4'-phosphopantetheinyl transferase superfamily protein [Ignavibacterium sp.]